MPSSPQNPQSQRQPSGDVAEFSDPQTNQQVKAVPITAANLSEYQQQLQQTAGMAQPAPKIGDWLITQTGETVGATPQLVPQQQFLARYQPATEQARLLLRQLAQTPTSGAQGNAGGSGTSSR